MTTIRTTKLERGRGALGPALALVHTGRAPTRAVLTAELGVTRATAGAVAAELEALGLIRVDTRPGMPSAGAQGRPSHRLAVNPEGPVVLGAQVHADGYRAALVGLGGRIVATAPGCMDVPPDPAGVISAVIDAGAELLRATSRRCVGVGLAIPSAVTEPDGRALNPLHLAWPEGAAVREVFTERVRQSRLAGDVVLPCQLGNDVNLGALAEHRHGAGRDARHLLCVATGHRGVGGALVVDGRLHTGSAGLALEVGHVTVNPGGRTCHCGSRGCLDVEADPLAFLEEAGRAPGPEVSLLQQAAKLLREEYGSPDVPERRSPSDVPEGRSRDAAEGGGRDGGTRERHPPGGASRRSPSDVRRAANAIVDRLGLGLAGLVNILNPDRIVLGGLYSHLLAAAPDRLHSVVTERSLWGRGVPLLPTALEHPSLVGAAELAWQPYLDDPLALAR